ncbi:MAG: hypothetical protein ACK4ND_12100 [Cytophagaceae bacterium]
MGVHIEKIRKPVVGYDLSKLLDKKFPEGSRVDMEWRGNDLTMVTDKEGRVTTLFMGKRKKGGGIYGERYTRKTKIKEGKLVYRWECQGKISGKL